MPKVYNDGTGDGLQEFMTPAQKAAQTRAAKRNARIALAQRDAYAEAWQLLQRKLKCGNSDFAGWHGMGAADIGEVCSAFRQAAATGELIGYDGVPFKVGDRVELHPGCDLWMRGAKFGTVHSVSLTPDDRVKVRMDHPQVKNLVAGPADRFKKVRS